eukprot:139057-Hanusia_phi.AAC.2
MKESDEQQIDDLLKGLEISEDSSTNQEIGELQLQNTEAGTDLSETPSSTEKKKGRKKASQDNDAGKDLSETLLSNEKKKERQKSVKKTKAGNEIPEKTEGGAASTEKKKGRKKSSQDNEAGKEIQEYAKDLVASVERKIMFQDSEISEEKEVSAESGWNEESKKFFEDNEAGKEIPECTEDVVASVERKKLFQDSEISEEKEVSADSGWNEKSKKFLENNEAGKEFPEDTKGASVKKTGKKVEVSNETGSAAASGKKNEEKKKQRITGAKAIKKKEDLEKKIEEKKKEMESLSRIFKDALSKIKDIDIPLNNEDKVLFEKLNPDVHMRTNVGYIFLCSTYFVENDLEEPATFFIFHVGELETWRDVKQQIDIAFDCTSLVILYALCPVVDTVFSRMVQLIRVYNALHHLQRRSLTARQYVFNCQSSNKIRETIKNVFRTVSILYSCALKDISNHEEIQELEFEPCNFPNYNVWEEGINYFCSTQSDIHLIRAWSSK